MGKLTAIFILLFIMFPAYTSATSNVSIETDSNFSGFSGKIKINGETYEVDSNEAEINVVNEEDGDSSSSVSVSSVLKTSSKNEANNETTKVDLEIQHNAGPNPSPDSLIKVTIDGEDVAVVEDVAPEEEVTIEYSNDKTVEESTNSTTDIVFPEPESTTSTAETSESIFDQIAELFDTVVTFLQEILT